MSEMFDDETVRVIRPDDPPEAAAWPWWVRAGQEVTALRPIGALEAADTASIVRVTVDAVSLRIHGGGTLEVFAEDDVVSGLYPRAEVPAPVGRGLEGLCTHLQLRLPPEVSCSLEGGEICVDHAATRGLRVVPRGGGGWCLRGAVSAGVAMTYQGIEAAIIRAVWSAAEELRASADARLAGLIDALIEAEGLRGARAERAREGIIDVLVTA